MACLAGSESSYSFTYTGRTKTSVSHELPTPPDSNRSSLDHAPDNATQIRDFLTGSRNQRLELKVPKQEFESIHELVDSAPRNMRYEYNWFTGHLIIFGKESTVHESLTGPLWAVHQRLYQDIKMDVPSAKLGCQGSANTTLQNAYGDPTCEKCADFAVTIRLRDDQRPDYPLIVFEIGYSETEEQLFMDARKWLYETAGQVVCIEFSSFLSHHPSRL
jgi:hypothetical protein